MWYPGAHVAAVQPDLVPLVQAVHFATVWPMLFELAQGEQGEQRGMVVEDVEIVSAGVFCAATRSRASSAGVHLLAPVVGRVG